MCGRFTLTLTPEETARLLALEAALDVEPASPPRWNVAPGQPIAAAILLAYAILFILPKSMDALASTTSATLRLSSASNSFR